MESLFQRAGRDLSAHVVEAAADSLLSIAATHPDAGGRGMAFGLIRQLRVGSPPRPLISVDDLGEALGRVNEPAIRTVFMEYIGFHSDTAAAVDELLRIAKSAQDGHTAIRELERMGRVGRDALIRLDREGGITSARARARLETLRDRGFPADTISRADKRIRSIPVRGDLREAAWRGSS
jgi:hypothetical protein